MPRRYLIIICIVILICIPVLFIPFTTTVVPTWKLRVIDTDGNSCANKQVNQGWGHYSLEIEGDIGGSEYRFTDSEGYVEFHERTIRASLIWRVVAPGIAFLQAIIAHGSMGISGYVFSTGMKDGPFINYKPGKPLPEKIIVDRCKYE
ncbi:MAG: hypothetical protein H0U50_11305 [Pyrinomonadaceae bacterium]|nr:hypothetical protein [Pyrinomonadaceae bacterium]